MSIKSQTLITSRWCYVAKSENSSYHFACLNQNIAFAIDDSISQKVNDEMHRIIYNN